MIWRGICPDRWKGCGKHRLAIMTLGLLAPVSAQAQDIDYSRLQDTFSEPVTTSVTGKPQRASDAAASLIIITSEDIRRSPANDIPGLLKAYAGIDVPRWTASQADVTIRGGVRPMNPSLLVLVNGRQVFHDYYNTTNWKNLGVQLEEIQQIEVVKGPNSALFGFNAVSGVVNIITINPLQTEQFSATVEGWPGESLRASAGLAGKLTDGLGIRLSAGYEKLDEWDGVQATGRLPANARIPTPRTREASGELYAAIDEVTRLSLSLSHSDSYEFQIAPPQVLLRGKNRSTLAGLQLSRDMAWGTVSAHVQKSWVDIDSDISFRQPLMHFLDTETLIAGADGLVRLGSNDVVRLGAEYRKLSLMADAGYSSATKYEVFAGSAMWEHQLNETLRLTLAGRLDHMKLWQDGELDRPTIYTRADHDRNFTTWSFNAALLARLDAESSLRLAGGRGIEVPSLMELGWNFGFSVPGLPVPMILAGNPRLDPVVMSNVEIGYTRSLPEISSELELTAFYAHSNGFLSLPLTNGLPVATPPSHPFILFTAQDIGKYSSYGLEASLKGKIGSNWSWMLNYSWTEVDADIPDNRGGNIQWPFFLGRSTPEHKANAQMSYERGPWLATLLARYTSATRQASGGFGFYYPVNVAESLAIDAKVAFRLGEHATVSLVGENITDAAGAGLSEFPSERRLRVGLDVRF